MHMMGVSPGKQAQLDGIFMNAFDYFLVISYDFQHITLFYIRFMFLKGTFNGLDAAKNMDVSLNLITTYTRRILDKLSFASDFNGT